MAVVRRNALTSAHTETFLDGVLDLSGRGTSVTPAQINQSAIVQRAPEAEMLGEPAELDKELSWWDLLVWWHIAAMRWHTTTGNRAHGGPVFLPWHRAYLRRVEEAIQIVTGEEGFALPYWDWAADGDMPGDAQPAAPIWSLLGESRGVVTAGRVGQLRARLRVEPGVGLFVTAPRPIDRDAGGRRTPPLPNRIDEAWTLADGLYDARPWGIGAVSFRNKLEGFRQAQDTEPGPSPWMHNRVHVWVGGDMILGTSPNDPVFWLNHCNVDRIWEGWMTRRGRNYLPPAGEGPPGHRADDPLFSIVWPSLTPAEVLDPTESGLDWYRYDELPSSF